MFKIDKMKESSIGWIWAILCLIFFVLDYVSVGSIPIVGDIFDLINLIGGIVFAGRYSAPLLIEFIPVVGDLLPTELIPLIKFLYKKMEEMGSQFEEEK